LLTPAHVTQRYRVLLFLGVTGHRRYRPHATSILITPSTCFTFPSTVTGFRTLYLHITASSCPSSLGCLLPTTNTVRTHTTPGAYLRALRNRQPARCASCGWFHRPFYHSLPPFAPCRCRFWSAGCAVLRAMPPAVHAYTHTRGSSTSGTLPVCLPAYHNHLLFLPGSMPQPFYALPAGGFVACGARLLERRWRIPRGCDHARLLLPVQRIPTSYYSPSLPPLPFRYSMPRLLYHGELHTQRRVPDAVAVRCRTARAHTPLRTWRCYLYLPVR